MRKARGVRDRPGGGRRDRYCGPLAAPWKARRLASRGPRVGTCAARAGTWRPEPCLPRPSGSKGGAALKSQRNEKRQLGGLTPVPRNRQLKGEGARRLGPGRGRGRIWRPGVPEPAEQPAAPGGGAWYPLAPPRRPPPRIPGAESGRAGSRCYAGSGAPGGEPGRGPRRPPGSRHLSHSCPRSRAVRGALFLFRPVNVDPRPDCAPLPLPFLVSPSPFSVLVAVPPRFQLSFCCFIFLHLCFSRHFPPEKLLFRPGVPLRSQLSPFLPRQQRVRVPRCSPRHERPAQSLA